MERPQVSPINTAEQVPTSPAYVSMEPGPTSPAYVSAKPEQGPTSPAYIQPEQVPTSPTADDMLAQQVPHRSQLCSVSTREHWPSDQYEMPQPGLQEQRPWHRPQMPPMLTEELWPQARYLFKVGDRVRFAGKTAIVIAQCNGNEYRYIVRVDETGADELCRGEYDLVPAPVVQQSIIEVPTADAKALMPSLKSSESGVTWRVQDKILRTSDRNIISPSFELLFGSINVSFRLMISASEVKESDFKSDKTTRRGAMSFKRAKGKGKIELKCVELPEQESSLDIRFLMKVGHSRECGPIQHDFVQKSTCGLPKEEEEWDFKKYVCDESFVVYIELQPLSRA